MGAILSIFDMASDISVILLYRSTPGQEEYGRMLLGMLAASLALQIVIALLQNRSRPWRLLRDVVFVLLGLKPGECNMPCHEEQHQYNAIHFN